jgi:small nuclear ribonucleoprotein (snRNP)-like protein
MSSYADAHELDGFLNKDVVLDTRGAILYLGKLSKVLDHFYELVDADVHDVVEGRTSKELYVMEARKHGVKKNRKSVFVRKIEIISISRLEDVIEY